ncbi:hypothetical protein CUMW_278270, partial [Citrus unshiu]
MGRSKKFGQNLGSCFMKETFCLMASGCLWISAKVWQLLIDLMSRKFSSGTVNLELWSEERPVSKQSPLAVSHEYEQSAEPNNNRSSRYFDTPMELEIPSIDAL